MQGTGGSTETLGVDSKLLTNLGNELVSSAGDIPAPPAPFTTTGTDPISVKIMGMQSQIETPIQTGLPEVKAGATSTGGKVASAGDKYEQTDEQIAKLIEQHTFDKSGGSPSVGGGLGNARNVVGAKGFKTEKISTFGPNRISGEVGGDAPSLVAPPSGPTPNAATPGVDAPGAGTPGGPTPGAGSAGAGSAAELGKPAAGAPAAATTGSSAADPAASAASGASQMGQMISMPMQIAGQALGMVAAVPQSIMQGVESAVQQISQLTGGLGEDGDSSAMEATRTAEHEPDESTTRPDEQPKAEQAHEGAAPGQPYGERAPDGQPDGTRGDAPEAAPVAPERKPPAQTRPADADGVIDL